jgi:RecJ-like exonuclease
MKCEDCSGRGYIEIESDCRNCSGSGKAKSFNPELTAELTAKQLEMFSRGVCGVCNGTGRIKRTELCRTCNGKGKVRKCRLCGEKIQENFEVCNKCRKKPHAYLLKNSCGIEDLKINNVYVGTVSGITSPGIFVNLNRRIRGLIRRRDAGNLNFSDGNEVLVKVKEIKPNGEIDLVLSPMDNFTIIEVSKDAPDVKISEIENFTGKIVELRGKVTHIKVTGGPTIFTILDSGGVVNAAAFEGGERAYPDVKIDDIVKIIGVVKKRDVNLQVEIFEMERLLGNEAHDVNRKILKELDRKCEPPEVEFLIESQILEDLRKDMVKVAKELRRAIFESRPVIIRHHWDADGVCGGVALEKALINFIEKTGNYEMKPLIKRKVSRAPFYELEDVVKDMDESLEDSEKFGDKIPLVVLVDNGSGVEDIPAIEHFLIFGADVITIDHHFPDEKVDSYLLHHINPYRVGGDSNYTAGVLCSELARMIDEIPSPEFLAAVSIVGDRSTGEVEKYIELAGVSRKELIDTALALEFEGFFLRFRSASQIIHEILGFGRKDRQKRLVSTISGYAKKSIEEQVRTAMEGLKIQSLPNGVRLAALDVENYAKRFTFPPPGKLTGEVHDRLKKEYDKLVTIGYGPDFAVIRSEGVELDIPRFVVELRNEINANIDGGGHMVVGSLKFIPAKRKEVLARLATRIGML